MTMRRRLLHSAMPRSAAQRLDETRRWLDRIVIRERLCPFAAPVRAPPKLRLRASACSSEDGVVAELAEEAATLRAGIDAPTPSSPETILLVLDAACVGERPLSWRELISLSWRLQAEAIVEPGHAEHMQLVLFHPLATHSTYGDDGAPADAGDYTIRAPHPVVQLLREKDVLRAVNGHPDAAGIPGRNRVRMRASGVTACEELLRSCTTREER